jgi:hypothetical protein
MTTTYDPISLQDARVLLASADATLRDYQDVPHQLAALATIDAAALALRRALGWRPDDGWAGAAPTDAD